MKIVYLVLILFMVLSCTDQSNRQVDKELVDLNKPGFAWDLESGKTYVYSYDQTMVQQFEMAKTAMTSILSGAMEVVSLKDTTAAIKVKDIKGTMIAGIDESGPDTMHTEVPGFSSTGLMPRGEIQQGRKDNVFRNIFPLPGFNLKQGEKDLIKFKFPVSSMEYQAGIEGDYIIRWVKDTVIEDHSCALLQAVLEDHQLKLISGNADYVEYNINVNGEYYFDRDRHCFVGGNYFFFLEVFHPATQQKGRHRFMMMDSKITYFLKEIKK